MYHPYQGSMLRVLSCHQILPYLRFTEIISRFLFSISHIYLRKCSCVMFTSKSLWIPCSLSKSHWLTDFVLYSWNHKRVGERETSFTSSTVPDDGHCEATIPVVKGCFMTSQWMQPLESDDYFLYHAIKIPISMVPRGLARWQDGSGNSQRWGHNDR